MTIVIFEKSYCNSCMVVQQPQLTQTLGTYSKSSIGLVIIICSFFIACSSSQKIQTDKWKAQYGHSQGMDYLICKKIKGNEPAWQYSFEVANNPTRTVLIKSIIKNDYVYFWHGVSDTANILLPKVVRPLQFQPYHNDEKTSLKEILLETNLSLLKSRRDFFDEVRYFVLVDSMRMSK